MIAAVAGDGSVARPAHTGWSGSEFEFFSMNFNKFIMVNDFHPAVLSLPKSYNDNFSWALSDVNAFDKFC